MLNRTASKFFQALVILGFAASLAACGHFGDGGEEAADEAMEQIDQAEEAMGEAEAAAEETMESHADVCPHGGGACCEHEEPHPCCTHAGAESQPAE